MSAETWEVFLPGFLAPGLNGRAGQERRHWRVKIRDKRRTKEAIHLTHRSNSSRDLPQFTGPVDVTYVRYRTSGPNMDEDNLYASFKDIGDSLETLGVVDNDRNIHLMPFQKLGKIKGTLIRIELPDAAV